MVFITYAQADRLVKLGLIRSEDLSVGREICDKLCELDHKGMGDCRGVDCGGGFFVKEETAIRYMEAMDEE